MDLSHVDNALALTPAQQAAFEALDQQLSEHNVVVLSARHGMGKSRILRALHAKTGGVFLTSREFVEESARAHPLSLDESIYGVLRQALEGHDTVIADDFQFVSLVDRTVRRVPARTPHGEQRRHRRGPGGRPDGSEGT